MAFILGRDGDEKAPRVAWLPGLIKGCLSCIDLPFS
jgi:hypothetical protein